MKTKQLAGVNTQFETVLIYRDERQAIDRAATVLLTNSDATRAEAAAIIRAHGLIAFVGGHHVAIHAQRPGPVTSSRLALVTSDTEDWL